MIVKPDFLSHWKTQLLKATLDDPAAPLYVIALWAHCETSRKTTLDIPERAIAIICGYTGEASKLIEALVSCRYLDRDEDTGELTVHEWEECNAKLLANWENGRRGGRPKGGTHADSTQYPLPRVANPSDTQTGIGKTQEKPNANPRGTQSEIGEPSANRLDKSREDKIREEPPTVPQTGDGDGESPFTLLPCESQAGADKSSRTAAMATLGRCFRKDGRPRQWSEREQRAFRKLWPIDPEELELVSAYYGAELPRGSDYRRRDLLTLLNLWPGEVDRARAFSNQKAEPAAEAPALSTWAIKERLSACESELTDLQYPGGCAYAVELAGSRKARAAQLKRSIAEYRAMLTAAPDAQVKTA